MVTAWAEMSRENKTTLAGGRLFLADRGWPGSFCDSFEGGHYEIGHLIPGT